MYIVRAKCSNGDKFVDAFVGRYVVMTFIMASSSSSHRTNERRKRTEHTSKCFTAQFPYFKLHIAQHTHKIVNCHATHTCKRSSFVHLTIRRQLHIILNFDVDQTIRWMRGWGSIRHQNGKLYLHNNNNNMCPLASSYSISQHQKWILAILPL